MNRVTSVLLVSVSALLAVCGGGNMPELLADSQLKWLGPDDWPGRIRSVLIHPTDSNIIYAGAASGGIWKSTDAGVSWVSLDDYMPTQVIGSLAMDPNDPNTIYAGTGEIFTFGSEGLSLRGENRGQGIFVTHDAGLSWCALAFTQTHPVDWQYVNRIAISPADSKVIIAATNTGLFRSADQGQTFIKKEPGNFLDVKFHPLFSKSKPNVVATPFGPVPWFSLPKTNVVATPFGGVPLFSTDGGSTWHTATVNVPNDARVELAPVTQTAWHWRALVIRKSTSQVDKLLASYDGGGSFTSLGTPTGDCAQTNQAYTGGLWVDPRDAHKMLLSGTFLCKTTDGGTTFTEVKDSSNAAHAIQIVDGHAVVAQPGVSDDILVGDDTGLARVRAYDSAAPIIEDLNHGLRTTQFKSAVADPETGNVIGGTQDNGTLLRNGTTWSRVIGGDGIMVSRGGDKFYAGQTKGRIRRMALDGNGHATGCFSATSAAPLSEAHVDCAHPQNADDRNLCHCGTAPVTNTCTDDTPILIDPTDPNRLYVGCRQLWRANVGTVDSANVTWTHIKSAQGNFIISAMDIASGNHDLMWLGTTLAGPDTHTADIMPGGQLWKSTNATNANPAWIPIKKNVGHRQWGPGGLPMPSRPVSDLAIDPRDHQKVYVSYAGFASDNLWKTTDGGTSFISIAAGLPPVPVWSIAVHPSKAGWLYAGTHVGLYISTDDGTHWSKTTRGPSTAAISDLEWKSGTNLLTVATYGRGVYEFDASPNPERLAPETLSLTRYPASTVLNGHVENLILSDDKYFVVKSLLFHGDSVEVVLTTRGGFTSTETPPGSDLTFFIEASTSAAAIQKLEFLDFLTNNYVLMQSVTTVANTQQMTTRLFADGASRFINPSTRELRTRVTWTKLFGEVTIQIDAAGWMIARP